MPEILLEEARFKVGSYNFDLTLKSGVFIPPHEVQVDEIFSSTDDVKKKIRLEISSYMESFRKAQSKEGIASCERSIGILNAALYDLGTLTIS